MLVTIKLFQEYYKFVDSKLIDDDFRIRLEIENGLTFRNVLVLLNIPEEKPKILLVNSRVRELDDVLHDQDELFIYPPIAGG